MNRTLNLSNTNSEGTIVLTRAVYMQFISTFQSSPKDFPFLSFLLQIECVPLVSKLSIWFSLFMTCSSHCISKYLSVLLNHRCIHTNTKQHNTNGKTKKETNSNPKPLPAFALSQTYSLCRACLVKIALNAFLSLSLVHPSSSRPLLLHQGSQSYFIVVP